MELILLVDKVATARLVAGLMLTLCISLHYNGSYPTIAVTSISCNDRSPITLLCSWEKDFTSPGGSLYKKLQTELRGGVVGEVNRRKTSIALLFCILT